MTPKTRVYLVRHGEIAGSEVFRYNGQTDVPLTPKGVDQYRQLAERLKDTSIRACYASNLSRCELGAHIICDPLGILPVLRGELREMSFGAWEGMTWSELAKNYPDEWQARQNDMVAYRAPGGENLLDLHGRVMPVIMEIVERHRGGEVLVIAHGGVNRVILLDAIGAPFSSMFRIEQDYGCLNIIDYYGDGIPVVTLLNG
ncbi:MAG: alpha-ribazole phosphatase [Geobacteraceae bacterium]|nr:alpha-ribazole phosphatase [Geobacteraceae bacterium]